MIKKLLMIKAKCIPSPPPLLESVPNETLLCFFGSIKARTLLGNNRNNGIFSKTHSYILLFDTFPSYTGIHFMHNNSPSP